VTVGRRQISVSRLALWVLAAFIFFIPSDTGVPIPGVGSLSRMVGLVAFGAGALSLVAGGRVKVRAPSLFLVIAALFTLWSAATYFWSIAPSVTMGRINTYAQLAVMAWLLHQLVRDDRDLDFLWQAFVLGCYVMIGTGLVAFFGGAEYRNVGGRNPNGFAIVAALAIPMAWGLALRRSHGRLYWLNVAYPVFAVVGVVLAASRGGLLTTLVALIVIPLTLGRFPVVTRVVLFAAIATVTWAAFSLLPTAVPEIQRNLDRLAETEEQIMGGTLTGRTTIWSAGAEVFQSSTVIGVGMGGFNRAVLPILGAARSPHNAFLSVAVGGGIIALLLFTALVAAAWLGAMLLSERRLEHFVLLAAVFVGMMPTNSDNDKFVWFVLGALAAARPLLLRVPHVGHIGLTPKPAQSARSPLSSSRRSP
jgi:O-antigen ligase